MYLKDALNSVTPYSDTSYAELHKALKNSYVELSFWGSRNVYSINHKGAMYFEDVAQRITDLVNSNPHFNLEDRKFGYAIETKIRELYDVAQDQEKKANFITAFFLAIRNFFLPSLNFEDTVENSFLFEYCTAKQYQEVTGKDPNTSDKNSLFYTPVRSYLERVPIWWLSQEEQKQFQYVRFQRNI